ANKLQRELRRLGKYELFEKLGGGGCGTVYRGRDSGTGEIVAVKVLKPELAGHALLIKRFEQEFLATRVLDNPHIVRALDFGRDREAIFLVMEFVDGKDIWAHLEDRRRMSEAEAIGPVEQIAKALDEAHAQGMIHRDVKPDNILLLPDGTAKLTDFGLVKDLGSELNLTDATDILGTPNFMAPEQFDDP